MLYGPSGEVISEGFHQQDDLLSGGWREGLPWEGVLSSTDAIYGVRRDVARQRTRTAAFTNPLFGSAIEILTGFLVGDAFTYGDVNLDKATKQAIEDFWYFNDLGNMVLNEIPIQYLLDGEMCAVLPDVDNDPGPNMPARLGLLDVETVTRLDADVNELRAVYTSDSTLAGSERRWDGERLVWQAHRAWWNDRRGWPVAMHAVDPARAYVSLLNTRINTHDLQGRILGVQKVFVDRNNPQSRAAYEAKKGWTRSLPSRGGIVTMAMVEGQDGKIISDSLEFMTPGKGADDASEDAFALLRLVGTALGGMPEHWLGVGSNANRATAAEMSGPAITGASRMQGIFRYVLDRIVRMELRRRFGVTKRYKQTYYEVKPNDPLTRVKRTRWVLADQIEIPWNFPKLTQDSLADRITRATTASDRGWADDSTLSAELGYDPAQEAERMAARGVTFGKSAGTGAPASQKQPTDQGDGQDLPIPDPTDEGDNLPADQPPPASKKPVARKGKGAQ